jgi:hypothetical protein
MIKLKDLLKEAVAKKETQPTDMESVNVAVAKFFEKNKKKLEKLVDENEWDEFYETGFAEFPNADQDDVAQAMNAAMLANGWVENVTPKMPTEKDLETKAFGDKKSLGKGIKMGEYDKKMKAPKASPTDLTTDSLKPLKTESIKKKEELEEAEYHGRKVTLNKPFYTPGGPRKRAVYVKNDKGNVVKVGFGDPNMRIKKSIPARRKSYRARHHCENPGPHWKANWWSCKAW